MKNFSGVELRQWANNNKPEDNMIYGKGYWDQIIFARDILAPIFIGNDLPDNERYESKMFVIGTHRSKSVTLPVIGIVAFGGGLQLAIRNNFHAIPMTIMSDIPLNAHLEEFDLLGDKCEDMYCEGFPEGTLFDKFKNGCTEFSGSYRSTYDIYTVALMVRKAYAKSRQFYK